MVTNSGPLPGEIEDMARDYIALVTETRFEDVLHQYPSLTCVRPATCGDLGWRAGSIRGDVQDAGLVDDALNGVARAGPE